MLTSPCKGRRWCGSRFPDLRRAAVCVVLPAAASARESSWRPVTGPKVCEGSVAVPGWWRGDKAAHRADGSAYRGTKGSTVPTGRGSPNRSPAAGTDQAAPNRSLDRVVWIGASR